MFDHILVYFNDWVVKILCCKLKPYERIYKCDWIKNNKKIKKIKM